jgi:hypothetical protein
MRLHVCVYSVARAGGSCLAQRRPVARAGHALTVLCCASTALAAIAHTPRALAALQERDGPLLLRDPHQLPGAHQHLQEPAAPPEALRAGPQGAVSDACSPVDFGRNMTVHRLIWNNERRGCCCIMRLCSEVWSFLPLRAPPVYAHYYCRCRRVACCRCRRRLRGGRTGTTMAC